MSDDSIEIIRFGKNNPSLEDYESFFWAPGTTKYVEFFTNQQVSITVVDLDNSSQLTESLANLIDGHPMSIDFEWKPDTSNSNNPISLFQIGSSKGVLIVLNSQKIIGHGKDHRTFDFFNECPEGLSIMKEFLNSNLFYGKGMSCDRKKLKQLFSQTFEMEDIDTTRLQPHELTSNFSELVTQLIGKPDAKFKDQNISKSNWNNRPLSVKQVLYAAFDAYATRLFLNYFITKYGEEEFINPSTIQIDKTSKKSKKQKNKNQKKSANDDDDNDNSKKKKNNESTNKQNQKNFKPKFDIKVKFHSADDFLYLLDDKDYNDFGIEFNEIKKDSDDFVQTGVFPSGYNPRNSLKRRILCLEDIFELPDESETPNYFCKLCNSKIESSSLDDHIWMNHYDQLPFVYFPDQVPTYIEKCLHTVHIACSNFKFVEKEGEKNESSNEDKEESKTKNISESIESNNDKDKNDDEKSIKLSGDFYELEKEVVCTLCDHNFPSFSTFYAHIQHMHSSKSLTDKFEMSVKEILFYYFIKVKLFESDTHFCRLCGKKVDINEQDIDHCWRFHGEDVVKMLKHRPNRYTQKCFESCFPFGVMSIHPMNAGQMFKGSIACSFCKIGFDDPGELFVHLFHRHTRAIAVKNSDMNKWPLHASDLHPEFLEIMEMWCYQSAVDALSDESVGIIQEIDEDENEKEDDNNKDEKEDDKSKNEKEDDNNKDEKEDDKNKNEKEDDKSKNKKDDDKSTMKKKKNKKKKFRNTNKILYKCNECKDDDDAQEEFHSPKQLWNHIVKNHLIILFDFIA